jgi:hypothetical protein
MPEDPKDLAETNFWKLMFGVQIPILVMNIFLNTFIYTEDTVDFCIQSGDKQQALR